MQSKELNNSFVNHINDSPSSPDTSELFESLLSGCREHYSIPSAAFTNYNVKRGLRNPDGTGVMAGITKIGNAHGYIINEGERTSIEGELYYRGYNITDLIRGYVFRPKSSLKTSTHCSIPTAISRPASPRTSS